MDASFHYMKVMPASLMPIFRSEVQGRILGVLFANTSHELSVSELAKRVGTSLPTALRDVRRLQDAGIVLVRATGNLRLVKVNIEHPLYAPLSEIVLYSFGALEVLRGKFDLVEGLKAAFIYGSWAARYMGESGADPGDVDVLLIGSFDRSLAFEIAREASTLIGKRVNVNNLSEEEWDSKELGFVKTVQSRPMIQLVGNLA
jgi:DNA-binding transcriptional ArsR family regulator